MFAFKQLLSLSVLSTFLTLASALPGPTPPPCPGPSHKVQLGDTCQKIADAASLAVQTFQGFNPDMDCTNLVTDQVVCLTGTISGPQPCRCSSGHVVQAGDTCDTIANAASIAASTLRSNNPDLDCDKPLSIGQNLCTDFRVLSLSIC